MRTILCAAILMLPLLPARAGDGIAVVAVAEAPAGPAPELVQLAHGLRAALAERARHVVGAREARERLAGASPEALQQLERAFLAAQAAFEAGEMEAAAVALRAIASDLEGVAESPDAYAQWSRTVTKLAYVERILRRRTASDAAIERLLSVDPALEVDEVQYPPSLRRAVEDVRKRVAVSPRASLTVTADGAPATVLVNGKEVGRTPVTVALAPGRYRIAGRCEGQRFPGTTVEVGRRDRAVELATSAAVALRIDAGPGLAVEWRARAPLVAAAAAWLGAGRVVAVTSRRTSDGVVLEGALHEVAPGVMLAAPLTWCDARDAGGRGEKISLRAEAPPGAGPPARSGGCDASGSRELGAAVRQASVRLPPSSGAAPDELGALATYLLTGRSSAGVTSIAPDGDPRESAGSAPAAGALAATTREAVASASAAASAGRGSLAPTASSRAPGGVGAPAPAEVPRVVAASASRSPPGWLRPAAYATGAVALGFSAFAGWQALSAHTQFAEANAMLRSDGALLAGSDPARYERITASASSAQRNAYVGAAGAAAFALAAGVLGYLSRDDGGAPVVRF